jgi:glutamate synthase domain-containing protein 2
VGAGLRDTIRLGASGRIITGFDIVRVMALGADWCNSARGFMFALGCIQSMSCHTDKCPTGVATQDPRRGASLVVPDKAERVRRFQASTMEALAELTAAAGLMHPMDISRDQLMRRTANGDVLSFGEVYPQLRPGSLIDGTADGKYARHWSLADAGSFRARVA